MYVPRTCTLYNALHVLTHGLLQLAMCSVLTYPAAAMGVWMIDQPAALSLAFCR